MFLRDKGFFLAIEKEAGVGGGGRDHDGMQEWVEWVEKGDRETMQARYKD